MTLYDFIHILEDIALTQPNVNSVGEGDLYAFMNANPKVKYSVVYLTQNKHTSDDDFDYYSINLFYIDRLQKDKSNTLEIQSTGKEIIENIISTFCKKFDAEINGNIEWVPFWESFADECAGIYANLRIMVPTDAICPEIYETE